MRKVPESSGVKWCRFRKQVPGRFPEDFGGFRCMLASVPEVGSGRFRKVGSGRSKFRRVPESSGACWCRFQRQGGVGSGGRVQKVPESSGVVCCHATLTGAAM